jgi:hypothetical protein
MARICDMLDSATINAITGLTVGVGEELEGGSGSGLTAVGGCLWGKPSTGIGVEITAFRESKFKPFFDGTPSMTPISGVGLAAKGTALALKGYVNASLYVDFGTFGMLVVTSTKTATLAMSGALASAIK